jgi:hypothetical protein
MKIFNKISLKVGIVKSHKMSFIYNFAIKHYDLIKQNEY